MPGGIDTERYKKLAALLAELEREQTALEQEGGEIVMAIRAAIDKQKIAKVRAFINKKISAN